MDDVISKLAEIEAAASRIMENVAEQKKVLSLENEEKMKAFDEETDKETEKIYNQQFSRKLPQSIQKIALRKLIMLDNATCINDLRIPPSNHLELLSGNRDGEYSIRINKQYRICFALAGTNDFINVGIEDYH